VYVADSTGVVTHAALFAFVEKSTVVAGILALCSSTLEKGILIGLGGGGLVNFLHYVLPNLQLIAVELDPAIGPIAQEYFGVDPPDSTNRWTLRIGNGLSVRSCEESDGYDDPLRFPPESMGFLILDVDSKDRSVGMSCPPQPFVETAYLSQIAQVLRPDGVLAMNVSARDQSMLELVCRNVAAVFPSVFVTKNDDDDNEDRDDLNVAVFASRTAIELPAMEELVDRVEGVRREGLDEEVISDLKSCCEELQAWSEADSSPKKTGAKKTKKKKRGKKK
jgi:hypothetical protein